MFWELYQPQVVGQTRKLIFGYTLQDRAIVAQLMNMRLNLAEKHLEILKKSIQERILDNGFISDIELEKLATKIMKQ